MVMAKHELWSTTDQGWIKETLISWSRHGARYLVRNISRIFNTTSFLKIFYISTEDFFRYEEIYMYVRYQVRYDRNIFTCLMLSVSDPDQDKDFLWQQFWKIYNYKIFLIKKTVFLKVLSNGTGGWVWVVSIDRPIFSQHFRIRQNILTKNLRNFIQHTLIIICVKPWSK